MKKKTSKVTMNATTVVFSHKFLEMTVEQHSASTFDCEPHFLPTLHRPTIKLCLDARKAVEEAFAKESNRKGGKKKRESSQSVNLSNFFPLAIEEYTVKGREFHDEENSARERKNSGEKKNKTKKGKHSATMTVEL